MFDLSDFVVHIFRLDPDLIKCIVIPCQSLASLMMLVRLWYVFWVDNDFDVAQVADAMSIFWRSDSDSKTLSLLV